MKIAKKLKRIAVLVTCISLTSACIGCGQTEGLSATKEEDRTQIIIGSDNYPPFNYEDADGKPAGIDVDLATEAFDRLGPPLLTSGGLLVMDELGFLENDAHRFQAAVLAALDGSTPVLAAVKPKDTDFLRRVRQHPHGEVFNITPESREALYQHLRSRILQWNKEEL